MKNWIRLVVYNGTALLLLTGLFIPYIMGYNGQIETTFFSFLSAYIGIVLLKITQLKKDDT